MLAPPDYVAATRLAIDRIAGAAEGNLDARVEHCPAFDVRRLLVHTGGFSRFVATLVAGADWEPSGSWRTPAAAEVGDDPVSWHRRCGAELTEALERGDPSAPSLTWAGRRTRQFWYRRAAQELTVHWWDAEHARGVDVAIECRLATDGIEERLGEFGPRVAARFGGAGETYLFLADEADAPFLATMRGDRIEVARVDGPADVTARGSASDVLLFLWGRVPPGQLTASGDRSLLTRWQDRTRI